MTQVGGRGVQARDGRRIQVIEFGKYEWVQVPIWRVETREDGSSFDHLRDRC